MIISNWQYSNPKILSTHSSRMSYKCSILFKIPPLSCSSGTIVTCHLEAHESVPLLISRALSAWTCLALLVPLVLSIKSKSLQIFWRFIMICQHFILQNLKNMAKISKCDNSDIHKHQQHPAFTWILIVVWKCSNTVPTADSDSWFT